MSLSENEKALREIAAAANNIAMAINGLTVALTAFPVKWHVLSRMPQQELNSVLSALSVELGKK